MSLSEFSSTSLSLGNISVLGEFANFSSLNYSLDDVLEDNVIRSANFPLFETDDPDEYIDLPCHPGNKRFNCTPESYLLFARGPQMLPMNITILVSLNVFFIMIHIFF